MSRAKLAHALEHGELQDALVHTAGLLVDEDDPGVYALMAVLQAQLEEFDRARATLEALASTHILWRPLARELSLCIEAEQTRWSRLREPEIAFKRSGIGPPPEFARELLEGLVRHAEGEHEEARRSLERSRSLQIPVAGSVEVEDEEGASTDTLDFDDLTTTDALTGPMLVGIGPFGLLDIPFFELARVELREPDTYHDTLWRVAHVTARDGRSLALRVPMMHIGSGPHEEPAVRMGDVTRHDDTHGYPVAVGACQLELRRPDGERLYVPWRRVRALSLSPVTH